MMIHFRLLLLLFFMVVFAACSNRYYAPVLLKNDVSYQPKPLSTDESKSAVYISGGVQAATGVDQTDNIYTGRLSLNQAQTFNNFNLAYGVFGFTGVYSTTSIQTPDPYYFDTKSFAGIGGKASANVFVPMGRADFRVIGVEASYSKEFGNYAGYRNMVKNVPGFAIDNNNTIFSGGFTSEVAWKGMNPDLQFAVRIYAGTSFGDHQLYDSGGLYSNYSKFNIAGSFYMQIKKYTIVIERQNLINTGISFGYRS